MVSARAEAAWAVPPPSAASTPAATVAAAAAPVDPDMTPEMQLAWDIWHQRVAQAIYQKWNFFASAAFKYSPPLAARAIYTVTRDGRITDVRLLQRSPNIMFNALILQSIKSMSGDLALLQFPSGSHRTTFYQTATFTQNVGPVGFRYTTGDRETISGR